MRSKLIRLVFWAVVALAVLAALLLPLHAKGKALESAQAEADNTSDVVVVMSVIHQPLEQAPNAGAAEGYDIDGAVFTDLKSCMAAAKQIMVLNRAQIVSGQETKWRRFTGCAIIPAPGKQPYIVAPAKGNSL